MIKTHSCNAFFVFYKTIVMCYYNSVVRNCYNKGDNNMKTRKDELQDLFLAVKRHLLNSGRTLTTSIMIAEKAMNEAKNESIEDIRALRDVFIG